MDRDPTRLRRLKVSAKRHTLGFLHMPAGLKGAVASFLMVLGGAAAYHFTFAPLIEPDVITIVDPAPVTPITPEEKRASGLAKYFPPGAWELNDPITLENNRSKLIFQRYEKRPGNLVLWMPG